MKKVNKEKLKKVCNGLLIVYWTITLIRLVSKLYDRYVEKKLKESDDVLNITDEELNEMKNNDADIKIDVE